PAPTNWQAKPKYNKAQPTPAVNVYNSQNNNGGNGNVKPEVIVITVPVVQAPAPAVQPAATVTVWATRTVDSYGYEPYQFTKTVGLVTSTVYHTFYDTGTREELNIYKRNVVPGLAAGLAISGTLMLVFMFQLM